MHKPRLSNERFSISISSTFFSFKKVCSKQTFDTFDKVLQIKIGNYVKKLNWGQIKILEKLLTHVLDEKIIFATSKSTTKPKNIEINQTSSINTKLKEKKEFISDDDASKVTERVKGETDKALLIEFGSGVESWIPKSRIRSTKNIDEEMKTFEIDNWILQKNRISA